MLVPSRHSIFNLCSASTQQEDAMWQRTVTQAKSVVLFSHTGTWGALEMMWEIPPVSMQLLDNVDFVSSFSAGSSKEGSRSALPYRNSGIGYLSDKQQNDGWKKTSSGSHTLIPITNTTCNSLRIDTFKCMCCSESILSKLSPLVFAEPNNMSSWHWLSVNSHVTFDLKNPKHKVEVKRLFTNILRPSVPDTTTHGQRDQEDTLHSMLSLLPVCLSNCVYMLSVCLLWVW